MTSRVGNPDTDADRQLRSCLDNSPLKSFVMVAGAGSGKTTSLVKALDHVARTRGVELRRRGQKVACITYTEVAEREIWSDVGNAPLFHVSTIHSFLWDIVKPFQVDLREWVLGRLEEKIEEQKAKLTGRRTQQRTRDRAELEIRRLEEQKGPVREASRFTYGVGSKYSEGILGHDDIIKAVPKLLRERPLLRTIVAQRFPFIFVDESQDTNPDVVDALIAVDADMRGRFCLGFFGDPMQKIYATGVGPIAPKPEWVQITKPENFRCPMAVLSVINRIRADGDGLVQTHGRAIPQAAGIASAEGTARVFVLPIDGLRTQRLAAVRRWIAEANRDPLWTRDDEQADVRVLVIVHRMAANRLGFSQLYAALNDSAPASMKEGFLDGTTWVIRPFLAYVLPLIVAIREDRQFDAMTMLRRHCPLLAPESNAGGSVAIRLERIKRDLDRLLSLLTGGSNASVFDVLSHMRACEIALLDERFGEHLQAFVGGPANAPEAAEGADEDDAAEARSIRAYLSCPAGELWGYRTYIEEQSPFSTQQGIKGAEFQRVLTVLDDEEGTHIQFSYNKYLGLAPLSSTDISNRQEGKDTVVDRTRRLMYVCCSRAVQDLAIVVFAADAGVAARHLADLEFVPRDRVLVQPADFESWGVSAISA